MYKLPELLLHVGVKHECHIITAHHVSHACKPIVQLSANQSLPQHQWTEPWVSIDNSHDTSQIQGQKQDQTKYTGTDTGRDKVYRDRYRTGQTNTIEDRHWVSYACPLSHIQEVGVLWMESNNNVQMNPQEAGAKIIKYTYIQNWHINWSLRVLSVPYSPLQLLDW